MKSDPPLVDSSERPPRWAFLACGVLVFVAVLQIVIAFTTELTPWKGGGFGMFATSDTGGNRQVRAYEVFDDGERRLSLPRRDPLRRVMLSHPTEQRVSAYAKALALRLELRREGLQAVRVELWRGRRSILRLVATGASPWHEYLLELQRPVAPAGARRGRRGCAVASGNGSSGVSPSWASSSRCRWRCGSPASTSSRGRWTSGT